MKKIFNVSMLFLGLSLLQIPYSYCQEDTTRPNYNNNRDDENEPDTIYYRNSNWVTEHVAVGIEAGLNISNYMYGQSNNSENISNTPIISGRAGVIVDIPVHSIFYIQPGLFFAMNGANSNVNDNTWYVNTVEVPVNLILKFGRVGHFFVGAGPFIGYNFGGYYTNNYSNGSLKIGSDQGDDLKALDMGMGINIGYEHRNGLFYRIRYQEGLLNLQPQSGSGSPTIYSSSYGIQVGFLFGRVPKNKRYMQHPEQRNVWDE